MGLFSGDKRDSFSAVLWGRLTKTKNTVLRNTELKIAIVSKGPYYVNIRVVALLNPKESMLYQKVTSLSGFLLKFGIFAGFVFLPIAINAK